MAYDLEERTIAFSKEIVNFCKEINKNVLLRPIANQLIRSATSVGANYCEANGSVSRKDFRNKVHICKKEAQETRYWLKVLEPELINKAILDKLLDETNQLVKIFASIAEKSK